MIGWVSGLVLQSMAFGHAFSLSCGVGWVLGYLLGLSSGIAGPEIYNSRAYKSRVLEMIGWIARHDCVSFWACLGKSGLVVGLGSWMLGSESQA